MKVLSFKKRCLVELPIFDTEDALHNKLRSVPKEKTYSEHYEGGMGSRPESNEFFGEEYDV